jgi:hypothetical protein
VTTLSSVLEVSRAILQAETLNLPFKLSAKTSKPTRKPERTRRGRYQLRSAVSIAQSFKTIRTILFGSPDFARFAWGNTLNSWFFLPVFATGQRLFNGRPWEAYRDQIPGTFPF